MLTATLQLHWCLLFGRGTARTTKGHAMNQNMRRRPQLRQAARRVPNSGNARQHYERYLARAREAQLAGDAIEMENCYQHAEHYFRVMRGEGHERRDHL
jgi:hypothetical protein